MHDEATLYKLQTGELGRNLLAAASKDPDNKKFILLSESGLPPYPHHHLIQLSANYVEICSVICGR